MRGVIPQHVSSLVRRLPSRAIAYHTRTLARASRQARVHVGFALLAASLSTQRIESWSHSARRWEMADEVVDAMALAYVGREVTDAGARGGWSFASDFGDTPTILAFFSLDGEASGIMLRDISWLTELFGRRGLRVVAVSIDDSTRAGEVAAEGEGRAYPYSWVMDTPAHASRLDAAREMPMAFLIVRGRIVRRSFDLVPEYGRSIWGGMRIQMELDDLLPKVDAAATSH